ncbi:hypothetical protein GCM10027569_00430 [Flindersiella endophytica]
METMPDSVAVTARTDKTAQPGIAPHSTPGWTRHFRRRPGETYADRFRGLLRSARQVGLANGVRALWYSAYRARLDAADRQRSLPATRTRRTPGLLQDAEEIRGGARFRYADAVLSVRILADGGGVFVGWDDAEPLPSYALEPAGGAPEFDRESVLTRGVGCWSVTGADVTVVVDSEGGLAFHDRSGTTFRQDAPPRWEGESWTHTTQPHR